MKEDSITTICVVGAGFMGTQIALQCAAHGYTVWCVDRLQEALQQAALSQATELDQRLHRRQLTAQERKDILSRVHFTTNLQEGASSADLVVEAVPERLDAKREVFAQLDGLCPSRTILATNSSSIRISAIENTIRRPDRVLNLHFYGVVWQRPMVELMRGTATSDETIQRVRQFARTIGVTPLVVRKQSTGFVFNRVWRAVKREVLHLVDDGVASHEDVDRAWMIAFGGQVGPFGLMDMVGLDVVRDIEMVYYRESGDEKDAPPKLLLDKIERGELGIKTGRGFYTYPDPAYQATDWIKEGE